MPSVDDKTPITNPRSKFEGESNEAEELDPNTEKGNTTSNTGDEDFSVAVTYEDLSNIVNIIDIVTKRGAFEGNELSSVGALRDKLVQFIQNNS